MKNIKKITSLILMLIMLTQIISFTVSATSNTSQDIIIKGSENGFEIYLIDEYVKVPDNYIIKAYSVDGGKKWLNITTDTAIFCDETFPKLLSKDLTLWLSNKAIDTKTKTLEDNAQIIKFDKINKRPKTPSLSVNYEVLADKQKNWDNKWTLTDKNGNKVQNNIEITGLDWSEPKLSDAGWYDSGDIITKGEDLYYIEDGYKKTIPYAYRLAPTQQGSTYTAGSKGKKISVKRMPTEPNYKVDTKTKTIKVKSGTSVIVGGKYDKGGNITGGTLTTYTIATEIDVSKCKKGDIIFLWTTATAKKPPSQTQGLYIE